MYLTYADFEILFENITITETNYKVLEEYAEGLVNNYVGHVISGAGKDVGYATGLIVQRLVAIGKQPQDLPQSFSEGGVSTTYKELENIPEKAKDILNKYRELL